jgi:hypothetical protein
MKKFPILSVIFLLLFLQIQCKDNRSSISIGVGFVFGDICIHEKPSLASECIQKITAGNEVELLSLKVGDSSGKSMQWQEIRFEKKLVLFPKTKKELKIPSLPSFPVRRKDGRSEIGTRSNSWNL